MATLIRHRWTSAFDGMSRSDRRSCDYDAYLPDRLAGWDLKLPADLVADLSDAEAAIRRLNTSATSHVSLEGLARFMLRAESVASSKIEGLEAGSRRLLDAEVVLAQGGNAADQIAVEVLANVAAMEAAVELGSSTGTITLDDLLDIHRILMERSSIPQIGGVVRTVQNWIGGSSYNPCSAAFVPPPPEPLDTLLHDLLEYVNGDDHPTLVQAAIAHAQFETIHPFADGDGRTGRALIHVILRRRGLARASSHRSASCSPPGPVTTSPASPRTDTSVHTTVQSAPPAPSPGCAHSRPQRIDRATTPRHTRPGSKPSTHDGAHNSNGSAPTRQ